MVVTEPSFKKLGNILINAVLSTMTDEQTLMYSGHPMDRFLPQRSAAELVTNGMQFTIQSPMTWNG
jgi:hypothetical protein